MTPNIMPQSEYGSKAQNLIDLQQIRGVNIPAIFPLAHNNILNIFKECGLDIAAEWDALIAAKPVDLDVNSYIISVANSEPSVRLRSEIIRISKSAKFIYLLSATQYANQSLQRFLNTASDTNANDQFTFMCRSSGDEDLSDVSNPGGNESYPSTSAPDAIAANIGLVLASYFKEKSFAQRRHVADTLGKLPQCSVLLQTMIGEQPVADPEASSEALCVSGVVFTRWPDGYTEALQLITAAYGHGEGVVQASAPTDSFLITGDTIIDSSISDKQWRIAPVKSANSLELLSVATAKGMQPSLTRIQVQKLHFICAQIEASYNNKALDIEWVFKDNKFYIVQVRELSKPQGPIIAPKIAANYIADLEQNSVIAIGQSIVPGSNVRAIHSAAECIIAENLADALRSIYYTHHENLQAIFVLQGLTTSHEANFFRSVSVPVISVPNPQLIKDTLRDSGLVLCCQTGKIYPGTMDNFIVSNGWYAHPMKPTLSILGDKNIEAKIAENMRKSTLSGLQTKVDITDFWNTLYKHINNLRDADMQSDIAEALKLITKLYHLLSKLIAEQSLKQELTNIFTHLVIACKAINAILLDKDFAINNPEQYKLQKLYAIQRLETILNQEPQLSTVKAFSLRSIIREIAQQQKQLQQIAAMQQEVNKRYPKLKLEAQTQELLQQAFKVTSLCMSLEFKTQLAKYLVFLAMLDHAAFMQFCIMLRDYQRDNLLDVAINFMPNLANVLDAPAKCMKAFKDAQQTYTTIYGAATVSDIQKVRMQNDRWRKCINLWGDPANFERLFADVQDFINSFEDNIQLLVATNDLFSRQLILNALMESLDIFDLSLKELSGSIIYQDQTARVENFSKLLRPYCMISEEMLRSLPQKNQDDLKIHSFGGSPFRPLTMHIATVADKLTHIYALAKEEKYPATYLQPSANFNVSSAIFTSNVNPTRVFEPMHTFVDLFTLAHQNFLSAVGMLQVDCLNKNRLPKEVRNIMATLIQKINIPTSHLQLQVFPQKPKLVNWNFQWPELRLTFICSLRNHSANITLTYNVNDPAHAKFTLNLFMDARGRSQSTRVAARKFKLTHPNSPYKLLKYNPILMQATFANCFVWEIAIDKVSRYNTRQFKLHIEELMLNTYQDTTKNFSKNAFYEPGMFTDSFAGLRQVITLLLAANNEAVMLQVFRDFLQELISKIDSLPMFEIEMVRNMRLPIISLITRLLESDNPATRAALVDIYEAYIIPDRNFQMIIHEPSIDPKVRHYHYYYSLLTIFYEPLLQVKSSEAILLQQKIKDMALKYNPLAPDAPPGIIPMARFIYSRAELERMLLQAANFDEFMRQKAIYNRTWSKIEYSFLDWIALNPADLDQFLRSVRLIHAERSEVMNFFKQITYYMLSAQQKQGYILLVNGLLTRTVITDELYDCLVANAERAINFLMQPNDQLEIANIDSVERILRGFAKDILRCLASNLRAEELVIKLCAKFPQLSDSAAALVASRQQQTELFEAVTAGNIDAIKTILAARTAYLDYPDANGHTAIMLAVMQDYVSIVNLLHTHGAKIDLKFIIDKNKADCLAVSLSYLSTREIEEAMVYAIQNNKPHLLEVILKATPYLANSIVDYQSPLIIAADNTDPSCVDVLLPYTDRSFFDTGLADQSKSTKLLPNYKRILEYHALQKFGGDADPLVATAIKSDAAALISFLNSSDQATLTFKRLKTALSAAKLALQPKDVIQILNNRIRKNRSPVLFGWAASVANKVSKIGLPSSSKNKVKKP